MSHEHLAVSRIIEDLERSLKSQKDVWQSEINQFEVVEKMKSELQKNILNQKQTN